MIHRAILPLCAVTGLVAGSLASPAAITMRAGASGSYAVLQTQAGRASSSSVQQYIPSATRASTSTQAGAASPRARLARVPLAFEPLQDGSFAARTAGATIAVRGATLFVVYQTGARTERTIALTFKGATPATRPIRSERLQTTANYFLGHDRRSWRTGVPTYGRLTYAHLYPGIDATYYGTRERLEYDLRVAAGADPGRIRLSAAGTTQVSLARGGNLVFRTGGASYTIARPVAYQTIGGHRRSVASAYWLDRQGTAHFRLGSYDHRRLLVIDPVLRYSTLFGVYDVATSIAVDSSGTAYFAGYVSGQIITTTEALQSGALSGSQDAFIAKLNSAGNALVYSSYLGQGGTSSATAIAIDKHGAAYITGQIAGGTFPTTLHALQDHMRGSTDAFITKVSPTGQALLYSTYLGGGIDNSDTAGSTVGTGIAVDGAGNAYITGYTNAYDLVLRNPFQRNLGYGKGTLGSQQDAFVTKLNPSGNGVVYSTYLGGSGTDSASAIALDKTGDAYITGQTTSADFPVTPHARQTALVGSSNAFVSKLNAGGTGLVFSTYLGASSGDQVNAITIDKAGNAYVAGQTTGGIPQTAGGAQPVSGGGIDAFITKMSPRGVLDYSTYLGGSGDDLAHSIAIDGAGAAYIGGQTSSADFNTPVFPLRKALQGELGGTRGGFGMIDAFVAKINPCGTALLYSSYLGGTFVDSANGIGVDAHGNALLTGSTLSPNFPLAHPLANGGTFAPPNSNGFVAEITSGPSAPRQICPLPLTVDTPQSVQTATQPLPVTIHTAPNAAISVVFIITSGTPPTATTPAKPGPELYRVSVQGRADAYGRFVASLQVKYTAKTSLASFLRVIAQTPHQKITQVLPFVFQPV